MECDDDIARANRAKRGSPFLKTDQAATDLKLSARLLKRLRRDRTGPVFRRHSRFVQYHIDDLDALRAGQSVMVAQRWASLPYPTGKRILKLGRLRLRGPDGTRDEFLLAATAQDPHKMAGQIQPMPA